MIIAFTSFKEKIRRKELYLVSVTGVLILLIFGTGSGSLTINGEAVTDYKSLAPILLIVINAISCSLAVVMNIGTIPNEYERKTSHLVWIRKIPQCRYHGELTAANTFSGLVSEAILFLALFIFMISHGRSGELWRLLPAYLMIGINVTIVSVMTSAFSILIPRLVSGTISAAVMLMGIFHSLLSLLKDIIGGFGGEIVRYALKIIPNLHGIQTQAVNVLCNKSIDVHMILTGMLAVYAFAALIFVLKRKEA